AAECAQSRGLRLQAAECIFVSWGACFHLLPSRSPRPEWLSLERRGGPASTRSFRLAEALRGDRRDPRPCRAQRCAAPHPAGQLDRHARLLAVAWHRPVAVLDPGLPDLPGHLG